ncbi:MAG: caspase family protein [Caldilineaceae bacterium]|nr:caspase family protein [Caldilineaceae bacterium]
MNSRRPEATTNQYGRGVSWHLPVPTPTAPLYAKSRALIIGINSYQRRADQPLRFAGGAEFLDLRNALNDARAVAALLRDEFEFDEVVELPDGEATRAAIEAYLKDDLPHRAGQEDRLVIFFAGHGHTQKATHTEDVGHLLTYDAQNFSQAISMDDLRNWFRTIPAKHILLLLDCCFSGSAALTETFPAKRIREGNGYLEAATSKTSWQILTAGRKDEEIPDTGRDPNHSAFTSVLLTAMRGGADFHFDGVITGNALGEYVPRHIIDETERYGRSRQEPVYRQLLNGETGNFVFLTQKRRLRDAIGQALLAIVREFDIPPQSLARCYKTVCSAFGRDPLFSDANPAFSLSELWDITAHPDYPSPILHFAAELAGLHPALVQPCELWRQQALAEPRLGLRWPETPLPLMAPGDDPEEVPFLTVSLDPVDLSPDTPPERNIYKVNFYYWQNPRPLGDEKLYSLPDAKAEVDRVIRAISHKYPAQGRKLAVEFCLPVELLSSALEAWPKRKDLMGSVYIGDDHPVVVRSIDGLKSVSRRPYWQEKWESFKACRNGHPPQVAPALCRGHEYQPGSIYSHYHQSAVHCLALTGTPSTQLNRPTPLTELLEAGIPIALWPRQGAAGPPAEDNILQALQTLLHGGTLESLPVRVQRARSLAGENDVPRHLTLLWDDYDRIPPQYSALEEEAFDDLNL